MAGPQKKAVRQVSISEFKAKCLGLLDEVNKTKRPLRITRRGRPVADVIPPAAETEDRSWMGSMKDLMEITGDIISPVIDLSEIEAMKE